ncbi:MAG: flagellar filament capping protein FliD, partial [Candidatus Gastranaerophilales bacterium]|nr:flagellar filament capping protein FliD [Candidatus Gastranaerophilales bacterium]
MSISFSGLASGLDTSSWVESLTALKRAKVEIYQAEKENLLLSQQTLNSIKNFFNSFRSVIEKVTDTKFGVSSMDLFAQNLAISSKANILTATANSSAQEGIYNINVNNLASNTQASSNYSYITTQTVTATATLSSTLESLGVKAGKIGVTVNGIERNLKIGNDETIQSFIEKLNNIGAKASYNENSGVFSINLSTNDIRDIDNTGIVNALHLQGVNSGYTSTTLQTNKIETVYEQATLDTKLGELGIKAGRFHIKLREEDANDKIDITENTTIRDLVNELQGYGYDIKFTDDGCIVLNDAIISEDYGDLGLLRAFGWDNPKVSSTTQTSNKLQYTSTLVEGTVANKNTLLKDIDGVTVNNGDTIIIKNSNNVTSTITLSNTSTIGNILDAMNNAGMTAVINSNGIVTISEGSIIGGTFDIAAALGLDVESTTSSVTSNVIYINKTIAQDVTSTTTVTFTGVRDAVESDLIFDFIDTNSSLYENVIYINNQNGLYSNNVAVNENWTFRDLFDYLSKYGIDASMNNGVISLNNRSDNYLANNEGIGKALGIGISSNASSSTITTAVTKTSGTLYYTKVVVATEADDIRNYVEMNETHSFLLMYQASYDTTIGSATDTDYNAYTAPMRSAPASTNSTTVSGGLSGNQFEAVAPDMPMATLKAAVGTIIDSSGEAHVVALTNGEYLNGSFISENTADPSTVKTFGELKTLLAKYDINMTMDNGVITMTSSNGAYVKGNLFEQLGIRTIAQPGATTVGTSQSSTAVVTYTTQTVITPTTTSREGLKGLAVEGDPTIGYYQGVENIPLCADSKIGQFFNNSTVSFTIKLSSTATGLEEASITVNATDTINGLVNTLSAYGVGISIEEFGVAPLAYCKISLNPDEGTRFIAEMPRELIDKLFGADKQITTTHTYTDTGNVRTTTVTSTKTISIDESWISHAITGDPRGYKTTVLSDPTELTLDLTMQEAFKCSESGGSFIIRAGKFQTESGNDTLLDPGNSSGSNTSGGLAALSGSWTVMFRGTDTIGDVINAVRTATNGNVKASISIDDNSLKFTGYNGYTGVSVTCDQIIMSVDGSFKPATNSSVQIVALDNMTQMGIQQKISELYDSNGNKTSFTEGNNVIRLRSKSGESISITISATSSLKDLRDELNKYGFVLSIGPHGVINISESSTHAIYDMGSWLTNQLGLKEKVGAFKSYSKTPEYHQTITVSATTTEMLAAEPQTITTNHTLSLDTYFGELGLTSTGLTKYVTIVNGGSETSFAVYSSDKVSALIDKLKQNGINAYISNGKFYIDASENYVKMDSRISDALNLDLTKPSTTVNSTTTYTNSSSNRLTKNEKSTAYSTTLLKDIGQSGNKTITASYNGNSYSLILDETIRIEDAVSQINSEFGFMGIYATFSNGTVSIASSNAQKAYITNFGGAFGITGNGYNTKIETSGSITNTSSGKLETEVENIANWNTTMEELGYTDTDGYFSIVDKDGKRRTISIDKTDTIRDVREKLAMYDIALNCSNGKITLSGTDGAYILTASKSINDAFNIKTSISNTYNTIVPKVITEEDHDVILEDYIINGTMINYEADGHFYIDKDGVKTKTYIMYNDTLDDLFYKFESAGISCSITSDGRLKFTSNGNVTISTDGLGIGEGAADLALLGIDNSKWSHNTIYKSSSPVGVTNSSSQITAANRDTQLSDLGVTTGEYLLYNNGVKTTLFISSDETLDSFIKTLRTFGIEASLVTNGNSSTLKLHSNGDAYIASSNAYDKSNIVEQLFNNSKGSQLYSYSGTPQVESLKTTSIIADENTKISDFTKIQSRPSTGSLNVLINGEQSVINIGKDDTIGDLLDKFNALGINATITNGQISIQSGFNTLQITPGTSYAMTNLGLLLAPDFGGYSASSSQVQSTDVIIEENHKSVAKYADENTKLNLLNISSGSLSIFRNGEKATIQVDSEQTLGNLRSKIAAKFSDVDLRFENGYLIIGSDSAEVLVGTTTDTSNFAAITGMHADENKNSSSSRALYCVNNSSKVTSSGLFVRGQVTEGNFKVGNATITIDNNTSLDDIISQINYNDGSNATAYWDSIDGKFVIKSKTTGASMINIEAGSSNFTDIMGFTSTENGTSRINTNTQELGKNARFTINGTNFTSTSNTVSSEVSRIEGVTINLKDISDGETVTLTIEKDKETAANAISDIVDAYNELIANVDKEVARGANLSSESTLKLIRNQIRSLMTSSIANKGSFKNLASIGISLAAASSGNIRTDNINELSFDKDKFIESFGADLSSLKSLLVGTDEQKGILTQVEDV